MRMYELKTRSPFFMVQLLNAPNSDHGNREARPRDSARFGQPCLEGCADWSRKMTRLAHVEHVRPYRPTGLYKDHDAPTGLEGCADWSLRMRSIRVMR